MTDGSAPPSTGFTAPASAGDRVVTGFLVGLVATIGVFAAHVLIFDVLMQNDLGPDADWLFAADVLPLIHLLLIVAALAVLVPAVFAASRGRRRRPSPMGWATAAAVLALACYTPVLSSDTRDPRVFLKVVAPVAVIWTGVLILLKRAVRDLDRLSASAHDTTPPADRVGTAAADADDPARPKIASAWTRALLGLLMALAGTLVVSGVQLALMSRWLESILGESEFADPGLGYLGAVHVVEIAALDLLLFVGTFAVALPWAFATKRGATPPSMSLRGWMTAALLVTAAVLGPVAGLGGLPVLFLLAVPPAMIVMASGVWIQVRWANRDLARACGTPGRAG